MSTIDPATRTAPEHTLRPLTVGDLMRPPLTTVEQRAHVAAAAYLMKHAGESALVVLRDHDDRTPLGVVTDADVSGAVADGLDVEQVRISDLLPGPMVTVAPD